MSILYYTVDACHFFIFFLHLGNVYADFDILSNFFGPFFLQHYIREQIPDPHNVELYLSVNDKVKQQDSTNLLLFQIPRLLSHISQIMTLEEGDIVLTGTPKGVGPVELGDVMKAGIRVDGKELDEGKIEASVEEKPGPYVFKQT